jgi:hypothetical protein
MIKSKITIDTEAIQKNVANLQAAANKIASKKVLIGVFDPSVAWYAAIQEFGQLSKPTIPERSFLRSSMTFMAGPSQAWIAKKSESMVRELLGGDMNSVLETIGSKWADYVVRFIDNRGNNTWAPLAPYTVRKKGHDVPLYDHGLLRGAITYEVW